ncbi:hypothetical protein [Streptomyces chryseus]|uniref:hypothetical protein n=1 Tax=Streptomyces chryseus TaxID=68186 RepID=UPI001E3351DC|nr:hypothetical protein [Streptomyces chryseus]
MSETARGFVTVGLAADKRLFRLGTGIPDYAWAIGATDDLGLLVEAVAAWRQGVSFDALRARFEFLDLDELTGALDNGEPARTQWSHLLSSDFYRPQWNLLRRLHSDEALRGFFPVLSHSAVRLRADPLDAVSRQVKVAEADAGRYEVLRVGAPEAAWVEVPAADLVACVRAFLAER